MQSVNVIPSVRGVYPITGLVEQDPAFAQPPPVNRLYNEFYCQSTGSNLNAGSDSSDTAKFTSTNGNWSTVTRLFTPTDGTNPVTSGVKIGDMASVYIDGASVGVCTLRILSVTDAANGPILLDSVVAAGTTPTTSATARTIKVGGAWRGPNAASAFPFSINLVQLALGTYFPRINLKNDATYTTTTGITVTGAGVIVQGYSLSPGDGGKAIIDSTTGTGSGLAMASSLMIAADIITTNSAVGGADDGFNSSTTNVLYLRCVAHGWRGNGFNVSGSGCRLVECEAYANNRSNTASTYGINVALSCVCLCCVSHDNTGSNTDGFFGGPVACFINCISAGNGRNGFGAGGTNGEVTIIGCDAYNNTGDGLKLSNTSTNAVLNIQNCNFIKNGGWGINSALTTAALFGTIANCGFGTGTQSNGKGTIATNVTAYLTITGSVNYDPDTTPWVDPANGNFNISNTKAISTGRGAFATTGYSGTTVGYPDIGAADAQTAAQAFNLPNTTQILSDGFLGHAYNWKLVFNTNVTITLQSGAIPTGLTLTQVDAVSVQLTGTPTVASQFVFTLRATVGSSYGDSTYQLTVNEDPDQGTGGVGGS